MKNIYVYTFIIGVILFIAGLWLSQRVEGFQGTFGVLLAGIGTGGIVYVADSGLTNSPNWSNISGSFTQISGSMGQIVGVNSSKEVWYTTQASPGIESTWKKIPGTATQVAFDFPKVLAVMGDSVGYISDVSVANPAFTMKNGPVGFKWIDISLGGSYAIGKNNKIYSCADITASNWSWTDITTGVIVGKTFMQLSCDGGNVAVVTESNELYYARDGRTWFKLTGQAVKGVAVRGGMLYALGTDNKIYYSPSQIPNASWSSLSGTVSFSYIDCILPINAQIISERTAGNASCENPTYELVGGQCMSPCPSGYTANGTTCVQGSTPRATRDATLPAEVTYNCPSGEIQLSGAVCRSTQDDKVVSNNAPPKEAYAVNGSFTQIEAQAKCESYGGTLASYQQVGNAQGAGAQWYGGWGWIADDSTNIGRIACAFQNIGAAIRTEAGGTGKSGAICYGVKPTKASTPDVLSFYNTMFFTTGSWNQVEQCDFGYRVVFNATCKSVCPQESISDPTYCTYKATPKLSKAKNIVNFTCPDGFDDPSVTSCSNFKYNDTTQMIECDTPAPMCYQKCPAGYTRNGTTCTENPGNTTPVNTPPVNTPPVNTPPITILSQNATISNTCPTGFINRQLTYTSEGQTINVGAAAGCIQACPAGYEQFDTVCVNISRDTISRTTIPPTPEYKCWANSNLVYKGPNANPMLVYQCQNKDDSTWETNALRTWKCPNNYDTNGNDDGYWNMPDSVCYRTCPAGYTRTILGGISYCSNIPLRTLSAYAGTTQTCPSNYDLVGTTCYQKCPAGYTRNGTTCTPT